MTTKHCIGIDISKATFTACSCSKVSEEKLAFSEIKKFNNDANGFNQLLRWVKGLVKPSDDLIFLMEATGVYYESLANHLFKIKKQVAVVLPNMSKHYFSSLNIKTKTDAVDAKIGQVAIQRKLLVLIYALWKNDTVFSPPNKVAPTIIAEATLDS